MIVEFIFSAHIAKIDKVVRFRKQNACNVLGLSYAPLNLDQIRGVYRRKAYEMKVLMIVEFIFSAHVAKIDKVVRFRKQNACKVLGLSYASLNLDQMGAMAPDSTGL